jgi:hypothetical protein
MTADGTVEWGEDRPTGWLDRLLGMPDDVGRRRISGPALGCAVVAVALQLAAQLTPWMIVTDSGPETLPTGSEVHLELVSDFALTGYYIGWLVLLALIGLALVVEASTRRLVMAAGLGWSVALLMIVIGLARRSISGGSLFTGLTTDSTLGPGAFFGTTAVLVGAAALALAGWQPGLRGRRAARSESEPDDIDPGPADLTVTPLK